MKELLRLLIIALILAILFILCLIWVSQIEPDKNGLLRGGDTTYVIYEYEHKQLVDEVPAYLFDDPEIVMEVTLATPCQAIEEPKKGLELIESRKPKMSYFGVMATTGYVATGNPCADGNYPCAGWTVACNDSRLWHKTIYIEGVGTRYVHDRGGMPVNVLDVFVGSIGEAYAMTNNSRAVYIVE